MTLSIFYRNFHYVFEKQHIIKKITFSLLFCFAFSFANARALCSDDNNGFINFYFEGGTPPYSYSWSNGQITRDLSNLLPGDYSVTITDNNNCQTAGTEGSQYKLYIIDLSGKVCRIVDDIITSKYTVEKGDLKGGFYFIELRGLNIYREDYYRIVNGVH